MKSYSMHSTAVAKRKGALAYLRSQLKLGQKPRKNGWSFKDYPPEELIMEETKGNNGETIFKPVAVKLTEKDRKRIEKEISTLEARI